MIVVDVGWDLRCIARVGNDSTHGVQVIGNGVVGEWVVGLIVA